MIEIAISVIALAIVAYVSSQFGARRIRFINFESEPRRALFTYATGRNEAGRKEYSKIDPLYPLRSFRTDPELDEDKHFAAYQETNDVTLSALICRAVCRAFNVAEYDPKTGQGLTETELVSLAYSFRNWVKKNESFILILPERPQLMAQMYPKSTGETMSNSSDFFSINPAPKTSSKTESAKV